MSSVDVETGVVAPGGGTINVGDTFQWTCTEAAQGTSISVTAQNTPSGPWFTPSPTPAFTAKTGSVTVTAQVAGTWAWTAHGVPVNAGARVHIASSVPKTRAS